MKRRIFIIISCLILIFSICFGIKKIKYLEAERQDKIIKISNLKEELESEMAKDSDEATSNNKKNEDADYEDIARKELGLIKKDEIIIIPKK